MYSRNTSGRYSQRFPGNTVKEEGMNRHLPNVTSENTEAEVHIRQRAETAKDRDSTQRGKFQNTDAKAFFPQPPPNYRGMIYDRTSKNTNSDIGINAEGIERLVKNDGSYTEFEKNVCKREYRKRLRKARRDNNDIDPITEPRSEKNAKDGIVNIIKGLNRSSFSHEDILLFSMMLLMLNSGSEDDIITVLVLLMLLQ